ncbi:DUF2294 family protein [Paenibacillus sp. F411]|uniref:Na-translocating system protein MpsC family protein n=1 Tax=unclassified Paenibacillus TaxID=185978 RepID=UPI001AAF16C1|nr:Na-translocating system protein MpsC family protein [Paenibacillus sp. F411]MBO2944651.1 DUF2294 family protein [Paenibacillus sp. F411]
MNQSIHQLQQLIASYTGKVLRERFGKGPESVIVSMGGQYITIYLRNFLTPSERVLLQQDHTHIVYQTRERLMELVLPEVSAYIAQVTGSQPEEMYYDWALHHHSGMITAICLETFTEEVDLNEQFDKKAELEQEIILISGQARRNPEQLQSFEMNNRTLLFIREGILVPIEKEFIRLGHGELLKSVKRNMEKQYLYQQGLFEPILNRRILDIFVDWDYDFNKSIIVMVTSPRSL